MSHGALLSTQRFGTELDPEKPIFDFSLMVLPSPSTSAYFPDMATRPQYERLEQGRAPFVREECFELLVTCRTLG